MSAAFTLNESRNYWLGLGPILALMPCGVIVFMAAVTGWADNHLGVMVALGFLMVFLIGLTFGAVGSVN